MKDIIRGKWHQIKGVLKTNWGKLTDDDLTRIEGNSERLAGVLQEKYGWSKREARKHVDEFIGSYK